ncbi:DUF4181 domain-containing protein [Jeotgalibacillus sp. R-1-5s-1]|uniref:DUF4181 domain-containing protein n=1 Tax=Jeotgalibacillus sp. R-1-5s-1 TaxID=2555897 RepID=UPI00210F63E3|nr:DUF4181 domain-containing protein [Jeotgalibacillus sp. R-1-5s-1]
MVLTEWYLIKRLDIPRDKGPFYKRAHRYQLMTELMVLVGAYAGIFLLFPFPSVIYAIPVGLALVHATRAIFEWRLERDKRRYVISLIGSAYLFGMVPLFALLS